VSDPGSRAPVGRVRFVDEDELGRPMLGPDHPFKAIRLPLTRTLLEHAGRLDPGDVVAPVRMDERLLAQVHDLEYVEAVKTAARGGELDDPWAFGLGTVDNPIVPGMDRAALRVCDATVTAADLVGRGEALRTASFAGGLHHAHRQRASGFCLFNDLALAIEWLTGQYGLRVAYLDIDAHHGDGVEAAFAARADVLTVSLHESGRYLFPGTGFEDEIGRDAGLGSCVNLPLDPGTGDASFLEVFDLVVPAALEAFAPDVLVLQAGADAHRRDPLAHLELSLLGLDAVYTRVVELADRHTGGRLVVTGGGGYDTYRTVPAAWARLWCRMTGSELQAELPRSWREAWRGRLPEALPERSDDADERAGVGGEDGEGRRERAASHNRAVAQRALAALRPVWAQWRSGPSSAPER
jgi:acetoin utilization protein AcuC